MGDECASKHEIQPRSETRQVESEGTAGKLRALPPEASERAPVRAEESAEVVVGGWAFRAADLAAEGPKESEV